MKTSRIFIFSELSSRLMPSKTMKSQGLNKSEYISKQDRISRKLSKRDSSMSVMSSCSVESDWSDEELEELEKMFGSIQHKSSMADTTTTTIKEALQDVVTSVEASEDTNTTRWRILKKQRQIAISKMQMQKSSKILSNSLSSSSMGSGNLDFSAIIQNFFPLGCCSKKRYFTSSRLHDYFRDVLADV